MKGLVVALTLLVLLVCTKGDSSYVASRESFRRPKSIPFPSSNRFTVEKYRLGRSLFFDKRLSLDNTMSCASCHNPEQGWGDGRARGRGFREQALTRRVPHLWNLAWGEKFFWDGRAESLEEQALGPIQNPSEMGLPLEMLMKRLASIPTYRSAFEKAFPGQGIRPATIGKALATFERTLLSPASPFDRWVDGDESALTGRQKRGFALFTGKANCVQCHSGWSFTNGSFADIGMPSTDKGRGLVLGDADADFSFKAPTLRNLKGRNFFLHDGSAGSIEELIENYDRGGNLHRRTATLWLRPLKLTSEEKKDLAQFIFSLSGELTKETP